MKVFFTTVVRSAPVERGGEVIKLDWGSKQVEARRPIVPRDPRVLDPNPRGGTRGGRGVLLDENRVLVADYHSIQVFDRELRPLGGFSNPLFANLHEIAWQDDFIWATSTEIDAAVKVDQEGNTVDTWWPREDPVTAARFRLSPLEIDKEADNRLRFLASGHRNKSHVHLNAAAIDNGRPMMLLNRFGSIVRLSPTEIVTSAPELRGCHNLLVTKSGALVVNNTRRRALTVFDSDGELLRELELARFEVVKSLLRRLWWSELKLWLATHGRPYQIFQGLFGHARIARPIFVRGLCETRSGNLLVGVSPATILEIDLEDGRLVDSFTYSRDVNVCVHGLECA